MNAHILVVEDDDASREALAALLIDHGYEVDTARDGAEAIAKVEATPPALIISDLMMPRGGGFAMIRKLRERAASADIPIVLVSALADRDRRITGLEIGADDYLAKPVDPAELIARVKVHLRHVRRQDELARRAVVDPLTGLLNRTGILAVLGRERDRAVRTGERLSLLMIDVDHFKALNDTYGHKAGDTALRLIALALVDAVRIADHVGRVGGDEFIVVVPGGADATAALGDRLRVLELPHLAVAGHHDVRISLSIGAATLDAGETLEALIDRADAAMYRIKRGS